MASRSSISMGCFPLVEAERKNGDVVALRLAALVGLQAGDEQFGLLAQRAAGMAAQQFDEARVAEAETVLAAGLVEETVGTQVEGPARLHAHLLVVVLALALVAQRAAATLEFLHLLAVA